MRLLTADALTLMQTAKTDAAKDCTKKVYEAIRYSDPMSAEGLLTVEDKMAAKFEELSEAVKADKEEMSTLAEEMLALIKERNNKCKVLK